MAGPATFPSCLCSVLLRVIVSKETLPKPPGGNSFHESSFRFKGPVSERKDDDTKVHIHMYISLQADSAFLHSTSPFPSAHLTPSTSYPIGAQDGAPQGPLP